jgi:vacuolar-type H+-ATPase subunit F/Vma7
MDKDILVIGPAMVIALFAPMGVACREATSSAQAKDFLLAARDIGLIVLAENFAKDLAADVEKVKKTIPVFVLPETQQSFGLLRLEQLMTKAIGKRL